MYLYLNYFPSLHSEHMPCELFSATLAVFWGVCAWAGSFLSVCGSLCSFEPAVWIRSGLWLSSAHAGHGALRPCIHSMLFSFPPPLGVQKSVFSSPCIPAKKKLLAFTFTHTWTVAVHLIPNIFQLCSTNLPFFLKKSEPFLPLPFKLF